MCNVPDYHATESSPVLCMLKYGISSFSEIVRNLVYGFRCRLLKSEKLNLKLYCWLCVFFNSCELSKKWNDILFILN